MQKVKKRRKGRWENSVLLPVMTVNDMVEHMHIKIRSWLYFFLREEMINETTEGTGRKREEKCVFEMLKASNL